MAFLQVDILRLRQYDEEMKRIGKYVDSVRYDLSSIRTRLDWDVRQKSGIDNNIKNICKDIEEEVMSFNKMQEFLGQAYDEYEKLDSYHMDDNWAGLTAVTDDIKSFLLDTYKAFGLGMKDNLKYLPFVGNAFKFLGSIHVGLADFLSGKGFSYDSERGVFGNIFSAINDTRSVVKDAFEIKDLVDAVGDATQATSVPKGADAVFKSFREYGDDFFKLDLIKGGCIDAAFSLVDNGFSNYEEMQHDGISIERAFKETIVETTFDVGTSVLIGAGVAALGLATGPGIIVAAGIGMGVNYVFDKFGVKETVSDFIVDAGEIIEGKVEEFKGGVVNFFKGLVNCNNNPTSVPNATW